MKIAFAFAGQGSQYVTMGKDLYENNQIAKNFYDNINVGFDIKKMCFEGPKEELNLTQYAQPCIVATSLAISECLRCENIIPEYVCGLSLGEYSALTFAGVFNHNDALEIATKRGLIMANALPQGTTGMFAVMGADIDTIEKAVNQVNSGICSIANYNSPAQIVITGENQALDEAVEILKSQKAKCIKLNVSGAFHSTLLEKASVELGELLSNYQIHKPSIKVVYNVIGTESDEDIITLLKKQIKSPVRFMQGIEYMINQGVDTFVEIGPGKTLSSFIKKINSNVKILQVEDTKTLNQTMEVIKNG